MAEERKQKRQLVAHRLVRFFQENKGVSLRKGEIARKYDVSPDDLDWKLRYALKMQWLKKNSNGAGGRGHQASYSLGPRAPRRLAELDRVLKEEALRAIADAIGAKNA